MLKCKCGLCNDVPVLYRGKYRDYAFGHNKTNWFTKKYIELYGEPICTVCGKVSGFKRKTPKKYCSKKCFGLVNGFSNTETQNKIKETIIKKYGVDNVSKLDFVSDKISKSKTGVKRGNLSEEWKRNIGKSSKEKWKDCEYRKKVSSSLKLVLNNEHHKKKRSDSLKNRWKNGEIFCITKNRFSKLHQKIREELGLEKLGFVSEQKVDRYLVDELNVDKKTIVEINGDYVHANPKIYKSDFIVRLPGNSYTAQEKWESDKNKKEQLEKMGFKVVTVWESDDLEQFKNMLV